MLHTTTIHGALLLNAYFTYPSPSRKHFFFLLKGLNCNILSILRVFFFKKKKFIDERNVLQGNPGDHQLHA